MQSPPGILALLWLARPKQLAVQGVHLRLCHEGIRSSPFFLPKSKRPRPRHPPKDLLPQNPESGKNHLVQLRTTDHLPSVLDLCHHQGIETEIVGMDLHDGVLGHLRQLLGSVIEIEMHPHHGAQKETEKMKSLLRFPLSSAGSLDSSQGQVCSTVSWHLFPAALPPIWTVALVGPVFRTDDLMMLFRNAVIPSTNIARVRSPPPSAPARSETATLLSIIHRDNHKDLGGRPPPDYGPYQGPGGGRGGRRY
jgi:hypothetical protein